MGISFLEPQHHFAIPNTPPELAGSPGPSSHLSGLVPSSASSRLPYEDRSWKQAVPISPPMSHYDPTSQADMMSGKGLDEAKARRETIAPSPVATSNTNTSTPPQAVAPRQSLPSLSSLFGPPPPRPLVQSPLSERPNSYHSTSPLDRAHASATALERSFSSSSYFPPPSSASSSQPRSAYEPRSEDRHQFTFSSSRQFPGPLSPRNREADQQRPDSSTSSQWSFRHDSARNEYAFGSRDSIAYKSSPQDRLPPPDSLPSPSLIGPPKQHQQHLLPSPGGAPTTSGAAITVDGIPVKDGLGPKIWTGTHFLPRFVRAAEVPGEGMCYFYDDGSHCKTVIDGEAVNAHWGVTKAGKPRKRLAIACVTCREKKIKCDPDYPRCVQCEKFGRVCKFKNAPRGGHNTSPSTPPAEMDDSNRQLGSSSFVRPPPEMPRPGSQSSDSVSPRTTHRLASPEQAPIPAKRIRTGYETYTSTVTGPPRSPVRQVLPPPIPAPSSAAAPSQQPPPPPPVPQLPLPVPRDATSSTAVPRLPPPAPSSYPSYPRILDPLPSAPPTSSPSSSWRPYHHHAPPAPQAGLPRLHDDVLLRAWQTDPYVSDPPSVSRTITSFFVHGADATALRFLPEKALKAWLFSRSPSSASSVPPAQLATPSTSHHSHSHSLSQTSLPSIGSNAHTRKLSPEDLMLAYSILALGAAVTPVAPDSTPAGSNDGRGNGDASHNKLIAGEYAQVARFASERAALSIQLVQARLLLCLYHLSVSQPSEAGEMCTAAVSAAWSLQLNTELDQLQDGELGELPYGLTMAGYAECRRRTFWACFVLERLNGLFPHRAAMINPGDVFLRLPQSLPSFEDQAALETPFFETGGAAAGAVFPPRGADAVGIMGHVVKVVAIWGEVMAAINRFSHRWSLTQDSDSDRVAQECLARLAAWKESLPQEWALVANVEFAAVAPEDRGSLFLMHLVYRHAVIKLHRHLASPRPTEGGRAAKRGLAREEAGKLLDLVCKAADFYLGAQLPSSVDMAGLGHSVPHYFTAFAVLEVVDVLSAEGAISEVLTLVTRLELATRMVESAGAIWDGARAHVPVLEHRLGKLRKLKDYPPPDAPALLITQGIRVVQASGPGGGASEHETGRVDGLRWQIDDPLETRFRRDMDSVYTGANDGRP